MIVNDDDVLPLKPLSYVFFALATIAFAHLEANDELLGFRRVVVAPNC